MINLYNQFVSVGERVVNGNPQIATQIESRWKEGINVIKAAEIKTNIELGIRI